MTDALFNIWETNRKLYTTYFEKYSLEQLNKTPDGFSNNLIWNIGHIVVAQQVLIYKLSSLELYIPDELVDRYKSGTRPTGNTSQEEADELRTLLLSLVEKTRADYRSGRFQTFTERMTGTGFLLQTLEDAFEFNNYHEGMHLGVMMGIRKFV